MAKTRGKSNHQDTGSHCSHCLRHSAKWMWEKAMEQGPSAGELSPLGLGVPPIQSTEGTGNQVPPNPPPLPFCICLRGLGWPRLLISFQS